MKYKAQTPPKGNNKRTKNSNELSRKQLRKAHRKQVKERNRKFHQNKHAKHDKHGEQADQNKKTNIFHKTVSLSKQNKLSSNAPKKIKSKPQQTYQPQQAQIEVENFQQQDVHKDSQGKASNQQQDAQIRMLEEKLGVKKVKNYYSKFAKKMGLDDDLFDFLNGISNKVKGIEKKTKINAKKVNIKEDVQTINQQQQSQEQQQINQQKAKKQKIGQKKSRKMKENSLIEGKKLDKPEDFQKPLNKQNISVQKGSGNANNVQQTQIRKSMTSLFNKLSDGNLHISFDQFMQIFNSHPKATTIPIFCQLFVKYHVIIQKPILHVFLTGIALTVGIYQIIGDRLMAPLVKKLVDKYLNLEQERQSELQNGLNLQQIEQIGYSRIFQRLKNFVNIICYLYQFGSITGQFLFTFVKYLTQKIGNQLSKIKNSQKSQLTDDNDQVQFLYIVVQKTGSKMRSNDPSILKSMIQQLKSLIKSFKSIYGQENIKGNKIRFIQMQLQEIRFNRQTQSRTILDQKMSFLHTFLNKNLPKQYGIQGKQKQSLNLNFSQVKDAKTGITDWWNNIGSNKKSKGIEENQEIYIDQVENAQKQKLRQLAKTLRFVTQIRQKIFFIIMQAQDYIQATQKIMQNKIKNQQDISAVILKVCLQQKTFNPYYALICSKIASLNPKFRLNIQYAIWDQLKQLQTFSLRQISNLGKFVAHIVSEQMANSSISVLKFFPDITQLNENQQMFMKIFMKQFFRRFISHSTKSYLSKLVSKLFEENNYQIRVGFNQYLISFIRAQKSERKSEGSRQDLDYLEMARFCRKLLMFQKDKRQQKGQNEDIKD